MARVINALEYYFILLSLGVSLSFWDAIFVLAFSSLIGNLLFFLPMQLGAREGGLLLIVKMLNLSAPGLGMSSSVKMLSLSEVHCRLSICCLVLMCPAP